MQNQIISNKIVLTRIFRRKLISHLNTNGFVRWSNDVSFVAAAVKCSEDILKPSMLFIYRFSLWCTLFSIIDEPFWATFILFFFLHNGSERRRKWKRLISGDEIQFHIHINNQTEETIFLLTYAKFKVHYLCEMNFLLRKCIQPPKIRLHTVHINVPYNTKKKEILKQIKKKEEEAEKNR